MVCPLPHLSLASDLTSAAAYACQLSSVESLDTKPPQVSMSVCLSVDYSLHLSVHLYVSGQGKTVHIILSAILPMFVVCPVCLVHFTLINVQLLMQSAVAVDVLVTVTGGDGKALQ